jgi:hypothetical protein
MFIGVEIRNTKGDKTDPTLHVRAMVRRNMPNAGPKAERAERTLKDTSYLNNGRFYWQFMVAG